MTDKKKRNYNWLTTAKNVDTRPEAEDDQQQIDALLVDMGVTICPSRE